MNPKQTETAKDAARKAYTKPRLIRWGTLRDLTRGGGGNKTEPTTHSRTRF